MHFAVGYVLKFNYFSINDTICNTELEKYIIVGTMKAEEILNRYITFFEGNGHKRIANSPLLPINDSTTLFTSSGMQALVPYLLGQEHPQGTRLVNVQNCFRAQDIDEIGDNRHTTFFHMIGNWSLGDYFKREQLPWFFKFLTDQNDGLGLDPNKLYVTAFNGDEKNEIPIDDESASLWKGIFNGIGVVATSAKMGSELMASRRGMDPGEKIFYYDSSKNWWSASGKPENMPPGELGGPDSEVFYDFGTPHDVKFGLHCHPNCDCGRFMEIGNSVFMQFQKQDDGSFKDLPKRNVDFGGGLERLVAATENQQDIFISSLFLPIIEQIITETSCEYEKYSKEMRIIADHLSAASFIITNKVSPSNTDQGYILRRLIRRAYDNFKSLNGKNIEEVLNAIISQYKITDPELEKSSQDIKQTILDEITLYKKVFSEKNIQSILDKVSTDDSFNINLIKINAEKYLKNVEILTHLESSSPNSLSSIAAGTIAFDAQTTLGIPAENTFSLIKDKLNEQFDEDIARKAFNQNQQNHKMLSKAGGEKKFRGGLADHSEQTVMGHTATHLMHQALRDVFGNQLHQTGSNITTERVRFDFNHDERLSEEEIGQVEDIVNERINENLPVHFELIDTKEAHKLGAIGLFMDTYGEKSKIYFIGPKEGSVNKAYSIEFCGGPHVDFTGVLKSFKIIKQDNLGKGQKRLYANIGV